MTGQDAVSDPTWFWWLLMGRTSQEVLCSHEGIQELVRTGTFCSSKNFTHFLCTSEGHLSCTKPVVDLLLRSWNTDSDPHVDFVSQSPS